MIQRPTATGIILCEQVIEAKGTNALTYVNCFREIRSPTFPTPPVRFTMHTVLTDGLGTWEVTQLIARPDTLESIFSRKLGVKFTDPLSERMFVAKIRGLSFPVPGRYQVSVLADGEPIAQCVLNLLRRGKS